MEKHTIAIRGVFWSGIEKFSTLGIQFFISVILARLLTPADYGTIALTSVLMIVLQTINESGFNVALMNKLDRDDLDYSSVFILNIVLGVSLYILLYFTAPLVAVFFNVPQLILLIRIVGLNLIISSFGIVQRTIFTINIDFKTQAKASLSAVIISGCIGITCAYLGLGVWALVFQGLGYSIINTIFIWIVSNWKPQKLGFSFIRIKLLINFAYKLVLARLIDTIFTQTYSIAIGKFYSPTQLGLFNRAKTLQELSSSNITNIVQRVSVPMLCEEQNDYQRMAKILMKYIVSTAFIVYPLLFGLFILADPFIEVLLTKKWIDAAWILKILCPVGIIYVITTFNLNIFNATGRTDLALKVEVIKKTIFVIIIAIAIMISFKMLVLSQIIIALFEVVINSYYTKKQIGLSLLHQLKALRGVFFASLIMSVSIYIGIMFVENSVLKLVIGTGVGIFVYLSICFVFNINNSKEYLKKLKRQSVLLNDQKY